MNNSFNWLHNRRGKFHIADIFISCFESRAIEESRCEVEPMQFCVCRGGYRGRKSGWNRIFVRYRRGVEWNWKRKKGKTWTSMRRFWRPTRNSGGGLVVAGQLQLQVFTSEFAYHFISLLIVIVIYTPFHTCIRGKFDDSISIKINKN
jgi:hypothetical protein